MTPILSMNDVPGSVKRRKFHAEYSSNVKRYSGYSRMNHEKAITYHLLQRAHRGHFIILDSALPYGTALNKPFGRIKSI